VPKIKILAQVFTPDKSTTCLCHKSVPKSVTEAIDTTSPTGRAMWQMVGILAELERSLIQERTKAGRAAGCPWCEDGAKIKINPATGRTRKKAD